MTSLNPVSASSPYMPLEPILEENSKNDTYRNFLHLEGFEWTRDELLRRKGEMSWCQFFQFNPKDAGEFFSVLEGTTLHLTAPVLQNAPLSEEDVSFCLSIAQFLVDEFIKPNRELQRAVWASNFPGFSGAKPYIIQKLLKCDLQQIWFNILDRGPVPDESGWEISIFKQVFSGDEAAASKFKKDFDIGVDPFFMLTILAETLSKEEKRRNPPPANQNLILMHIVHLDDLRRHSEDQTPSLLLRATKKRFWTKTCLTIASFAVLAIGYWANKRNVEQL